MLIKHPTANSYSAMLETVAAHTNIVSYALWHVVPSSSRAYVSNASVLSFS